MQEAYRPPCSKCSEGGGEGGVTYLGWGVPTLLGGLPTLGKRPCRRPLDPQTMTTGLAQFPPLRIKHLLWKVFSSLVILTLFLGDG